MAHHRKKEAILSVPQSLQKAGGYSKLDKYNNFNKNKPSLATNTGSRMGSTALPKIQNNAGMTTNDKSDP